MAAALMLVAAFALFHGAAHGREWPSSADTLGYACGFLAATALLHGLGLAFGVMTRCRAPLLGRLGGAVTAVAGAVLLAGAI